MNAEGFGQRAKKSLCEMAPLLVVLTAIVLGGVLGGIWGSFQLACLGMAGGGLCGIVVVEGLDL